jgi:hypothetical protein
VAFKKKPFSQAFPALFFAMRPNGLNWWMLAGISSFRLPILMSYQPAFSVCSRRNAHDRLLSPYLAMGERLWRSWSASSADALGRRGLHNGWLGRQLFSAIA